ncbi:MAG: ubiquinone/menaquinone biosynthesis C-methylase UbiE [Urechidicola sp.]|jgi:ubiquinone/menaquinone biosynthesis C-methylase UbiE
MTKTIKEFWNDQAKEFGVDSLATMPDTYLKELEIENISKYLEQANSVVDIGCGNGYSTFEYSKKIKGDILGIDFSDEMIKYAKQVGDQSDEYKNVQFMQGDVRNLDIPDESMDLVITDRCLINLESRSDQKKAIDEVFRVLKPGGRYLMCEDTEQGLKNLNQLRKQAALEEILVRWHNLYLDESHLKSCSSSKFFITDEIRFSSFYYVATRIINGGISRDNNQSPDYLDPINKYSRLISGQGEFGDFGPLKLFVWDKAL